jgi:EAL domain-containing protein (putative c-di-GMP-specific phosphodiesterase class I)
LEVNEKTVTDRQVIRELRSELNDLQIGLAYDDFGAGQARLLELIEVPPDYLKFDAFLIRDLHHQPHRFQRALAALVEMSVDLGVIPLAEGVETDEEAAACDALGFQALQGFLFGHPRPITELSDTPEL